METVSVYKLSHVDILRGLVTEKLTTAVREILAVVETTVEGYENEVLLLKRELDHRKKQLAAILQPQVSLYRIDDAVSQDTLCHVSTDGDNDDPCIKSKTLEHKENKEHPTPEISTWKNEVESVPTDEQVSQQDMVSSEHEDGDCTIKDLPTESSESCHSDDNINDAQNTDSNIKRRKRLPRRYKSNHTGANTSDNAIEDNSDNNWEPDQNEKLQASNVKKKRVIKLQIGVLNCSDTELDNAFRPAPVQTIMCQQNLSESHFLKELRSAIPELREDKPFEVFLSDSNKRSPLLVNKMTPANLYKAFRLTKKRQFAFYIQLKEHKDYCDTLTNTPTNSHDDNKPSTSSCGSLEEQPSEIGDICKSTDEAYSMSSADSATLSEEDEDDHDRSKDWKAEQNCTDKSQECLVCGTLFRSKTILTKHALNHVDNPEGLCGVCGQQFRLSKELRCHLDTHQKLHQCDTCGRVFISKVGWQRHFDTHGIEKPFKCKVCPKVFVCEDDFRRHELDHKDKPYKCDTCPKAFWYKLQLDVHNQTHTGQKPYCCDVCGKLLSDFRSLCRHKQIHEGQKNYSCKYCDKLFLCPSRQKQHEKIHTTREKNFLCDICSKSFYSQALLNGHRERHDNKHIQICSVCKKTIKGDLRRHMMVHTGERPFSCSECDMKFKYPTHLKYHLVTHTGIKPFTCKVCQKSYGRPEHLKVHMRTHTGDKPYKCTLCDKAFTQGHCLKTHMKSHQGK